MESKGVCYDSLYVPFQVPKALVSGVERVRKPHFLDKSSPGLG